MNIIVAIASFWNKLIAIITQLLQLMGYNKNQDDDNP